WRSFQERRQREWSCYRLRIQVEIFAESFGGERRADDFLLQHSLSKVNVENFIAIPTATGTASAAQQRGRQIDALPAGSSAVRNVLVFSRRSLPRRKSGALIDDRFTIGRGLHGEPAEADARLASFAARNSRISGEHLATVLVRRRDQLVGSAIWQPSYA